MDIESQIEVLENTNSWTEKVKLMRQIREQIKEEQNKLDLLLESIINNKSQKSKKVKMDKLNIDTLISTYKTLDDFEEKLKMFYLIKEMMVYLENTLFC